MDKLLWFLSIFSALAGAVAIYQSAGLRYIKKHRSELQYLLAGIHQLAVAKNLAWSKQTAYLPPVRDEKDLAVLRAHVQAGDGFMEIAGTISALEGVILTDKSAIESMIQKALDQSRLNNQLQAEGLKNPSFKGMPKTSTEADDNQQETAELDDKGDGDKGDGGS